MPDALPLAEGLEAERGEDLEPYKQQAKSLFRRLGAEGAGVSHRAAPAAAARSSFESGGYCFHVLAEAGVAYLTLADKSYPKKLAYQVHRGGGEGG